MLSVLNFEAPLPALDRSDAIYRHNDWGEKSGQSLGAFTQMFELSRRSHPERDARNFVHALKVMIGGNCIADEYEAAVPDEPPLDRLVINGAAFFHDAEPTELGSALLFAYHAARLGFSPEKNEEVGRAILSTAEDIPPKTPTEKALTITDILNIGDPDRAAVIARGKQFEAEEKKAKGASYDPIAYNIKNLTKVVKLIMQDLSLGGIEQPWLLQAKSNVRDMVKDFAVESDLGVPAVVEKLGPAALDLFASAA